MTLEAGAGIGFHWGVFDLQPCIWLVRKSRWRLRYARARAAYLPFIGAAIKDVAGCCWRLVVRYERRLVGLS